MKLEGCGIHGNLLSWMESFLTKRVQTVICEGATSNLFPRDLGCTTRVSARPAVVPNINELLAKRSNLYSQAVFADDTLLYGVVVDDSDCDSLPR